MRSTKTGNAFSQSFISFYGVSRTFTDHTSVYFSIVASELGRATLFSENLKEAAELVKQIVLA